MKKALKCRTFAVAAAFSLFSFAALAQTNDPGVKIRRNLRDNTPASVIFDDAAAFPADQASNLLTQHLQLNSAVDRMVPARTTKSKQLEVQRFTQYYKDIKVEHGSYTVVSKNGKIAYMMGDFFRVQDNPSAVPVLDESGALDKAISFTGAQRYMWQESPQHQLALLRGKQDTSFYPEGSLVWVQDVSSGKPDGRLHLAWKFGIYASKPVSNMEVYVDAKDGKILFKNDLLKHVTATAASLYNGTVSVETEWNGFEYVLNDLTRGSGIYTFTMNNDISFSTDITNPTTTWAASAGIDAHWAAEKIYDYWMQEQGRSSYDGLGTEMINFVNFDIDYNNAFWDGTSMHYGDGSGSANGGYDPMVSLDICAHEIGHGICEYTCGLVYEGESGALNEGFSDIWGAVIEAWANPNETDAKAKNNWEIGEEVGTSPLRSMANPNLYGDPDTYDGLNWVNTSFCTPDAFNDNCGVHTNSGLLNHWFYLMVNGGAGVNDLGNSYAVPDISMADAAAIVYNTELSLSPFSQYVDARDASIAAATSIFGACSMQTEAVTRAWYAVGVGTDYTPCTPQVHFQNSIATITEDADLNSCTAGKLVNIPVMISGPAPAGGTATATLTITGGTAVAGTDYTLGTTSVDFPAGSSTPQNFTITVFDNGAVSADRDILFEVTLTPNGSDATLASVLTETRLIIANDDKAPELGGDQTHTVGTATVVSNMSSPFFSMASAARTHYFITAAEMQAAGVKPNTPIKAVAFNVLQKMSNQPFSDYTLKMGHTISTNLIDAVQNASVTPVYSANLTTTTGWNTLTFNNTFTWNGVDNVLMEICFANIVNDNDNDQVAGTEGGMITTYNYDFWGDGCLLWEDFNNLSNARPVMRFTQTVAPATIETVANSSRSWNVKSGQNIYFYNQADGDLIARIDDPSADLGCVEAKVSQQGNGFVPAAFGDVNRSVKEFVIIPSQNGQTASYAAAIYLTDNELGTVNTSNIRIVKTTAATDADITPANTQIVLPSLVNGQNYKGFKGNFTGFSRFFVIDNPITLSVKEFTGGNRIIVGNPFSNSIQIRYTVSKTEKAEIRLMDITGKLVYSTGQTLSPSGHELEISVEALNLAPGYYMLQLVIDGMVMNEKLLKN